MALIHWTSNPNLTPCDLFLWGYKVFIAPLSVDLAQNNTSERCPLRDNGDSMRTWRNLGARVKVVSFMATKLATSRPCWRVRDPLDSSGNLWRNPLTSRPMTQADIFL
ncbi:hypothetical protein TNCV_106621 [Trichonephila clavipes]|nr:hypothetical protein TNCV_106621 [Trichonephila clavipes]